MRVPDPVARVGEPNRLVGDEPDAEGRGDGERRERGDLERERNQSDQPGGDQQPLAVQGANVAEPEEDVRAEVERDPGSAEPPRCRLAVPSVVHNTQRVVAKYRERGFPRPNSERSYGASVQASTSRMHSRATGAAIQTTG